MFLRRIIRFGTAFLCMLIIVSGCFCLRGLSLCRFSALPGERCFYTFSASSLAKIQKRVRIFDYFNVKGESVHFSFVGDKGNKALEIANLYDAEILFSEEAEDVTSYYCYTQKWKEGTFVNGRLINLHIAVSSERCSVGYPIIFGGF